MRSLRSTVIFALALLAGLAAASSASAAIPWASCTPAGFQCATMTTPLDPTGVTPGTVSLDVTRRPALSTGGSKTAIVVLAGGPGQAAIPFASTFGQVFGTALDTDDLLVFNQRGTGNSSPIICPAIARTSGSMTKNVQDCSLELGTTKNFYTTAQSVSDLEQLRIAGGYDKLILFGVSYGTKVALDYAAQYPASTQSLILDSIVEPEGEDAMRRSTLRAVTRVIGTSLCGDNACAAAGGDAVGDLTTLVGRLKVKSMKGVYYIGDGRGYNVTVTLNDLINTMIAGDMNPALRAQLPGAVHAALRGDRAALVRLVILAETASGDSISTGKSIPAANRLAIAASAAAATSSTATTTATAAAAESEAAIDAENSLYFSTICEETVFPWTRGAPLSQRLTEVQNAAKALPAGSLGIFGNSDVAALGGTVSNCLGWVTGSPAPTVPVTLPNIPALLLDGQSDLRTPVEDAQALASRLPQAQLVTIPNTGHSVVTAEAGSCAKLAVRTFLAGGAAAACAAADNPYPPTATPPHSVSDVASVKGVSKLSGQTLNSLGFTLLDGRRQLVTSILANDAVPKTVGGLRGGSLLVVNSKKLQYRSYEFVPGVRVTGFLLSSGTSTFKLTGSKGAHGTVKILSNGVATGTLNGKKFRVSPKARSARVTTTGDLPTIAGALAQARSTIE